MEFDWVLQARCVASLADVPHKCYSFRMPVVGSGCTLAGRTKEKSCFGRLPGANATWCVRLEVVGCHFKVNRMMGTF